MQNDSGHKEMFIPSSREEWRLWLKKNHNIYSEIWLVYYKKASNIPTLSYNDSVEEAVCYGWIDGTKKRIDDKSYCHRFTPRRSKSMWSETNVRRARNMIKLGKMSQAGLQHFEEALNKPGRIIVESSTPGADDFPDDLEKALKVKADAFSNFISFPPSYRKLCIRWIVAAKRDETRMKRIIEVVEKTAAGERIGMK